jgi:hypothetical protein
MSTIGDDSPMSAGSADFVFAVRRTPLAEVGYRAASGLPHAAVLVPLVQDDAVVFALPYAHRRLAEAIAAAGEVTVVCSDARLGRADWQPLAATGSVEVEADLDGTVFRAHLLEQELRKHPPARLLADSLMLQREHWWYLPRLLLRLRRVDAVWTVAPRTAAEQGVLFWDAGTALHADTVAVGEQAELVLGVSSLGGGDLATAGPACLLRHDCSIPDLEQRSQLVQQGLLEGATLRIEHEQGALPLPSAQGVLARYRQARAFERACRRALRASEQAPGT